MSPRMNWLWDWNRSISVSYHRLSDIDKSDSEILRPSASLSAKPSRWMFYLLCLSTAAFLSSVGTYFIIPNRETKTDMLTCGTTNEEAMAQGCIMEPMVYGWMPKPCYFPELSSQYTPFEDRDWYTSNSYLEEEKIPPADIWAGKHQHIFTRQYHGDHCLFLWRKLNLAVQRKSKWLDHKTLDLAHTEHCVMELEDHGIEWKNSSNNVVLGFYRCLRLDSI